MTLADANIQKRGNQLHVSYGDDSGLYVEFFNKPVEMRKESEKEGRPIYKDIPYIRIRPVGQNQTVVERKIRDEDKTRFPNKYQAFVNQEKEVEEGTPITEWAPITKSQALELKGMNIHTVENLASVSDVNLTWMGARDLREKAKTWLEQAKDKSVAVQWEAEKAKMEKQIEALKNEIKELGKVKGKNGKNASTASSADSE